MNFTETLCFVLVAVYGFTSLLLSILVACAWCAGVERRHATSDELLVLRLLPSVGASFLTLTVALPAFLIYEPAHDMEHVGPLLVVLAMFALITVGHGILRGWRACVAARVLLGYRPAGHVPVTAGHKIDMIDVPEPIVAVVGGWRPRIVAAKRVVAACSQEEFRQVIAHEAAHLSSHDNLKLLLLVISPDALAWLPAGGALAARWRVAAEFEADERATGPDRRKRVALASALIKVARLSISADRAFPALSLLTALDDVEGRVRQLLARSSEAPRRINTKAVVAVASLVPVIAVPLYGLIQQFVEALVAFGR
jgi:Zn-dependent protease with chaperone function